MTAPVLLVEDQWAQQGAGDVLATELGQDVEVVKGLSPLFAAVDRLIVDPRSREPVIVLDQGLPEICRFETLPTVLERVHGANVVLWTMNETIQIHGDALVTGARASLSKSKPVDLLARVVDWVSTGRVWCQPDQALWLADLVSCIEDHERNSRQTVWKSTELAGASELLAYLDQLQAVAEGEPLPADERWLRELVQDLKPLWLADRHRKVLRALATSQSRKDAANLLDVSLDTANGYVRELSGRLMPHRHRSGSAGPRSDGGVVHTVTLMHHGCSLGSESHFVSDES